MKKFFAILTLAAIITGCGNSATDATTTDNDSTAAASVQAVAPVTVDTTVKVVEATTTVVAAPVK